MLARLWKQATRIIVIVSAVLSFFVLMELLHVYQTLHGLHPWAGYVFVGVLAGSAVWLTVRMLGGWRMRPRTLRPPEVGELDSAGLSDLRRYGRYLARYLDRLAMNESLREDQRQGAVAAAVELARAVRSCRSAEEALSALRGAEKEQIEPLLNELDAKAEREIGECVRDVMVAVAASPWPLLDAAIVIYRNGGMVSRITHIYNSRPPLREQISIFADTARIVATIKLTHLMRKLLESFAKSMPLVGRVAESLTQALVAGVLTSAAGHAAKHRCRAFRGWNRAEAVQDLMGKMGDFLTDCQRVATESLLGLLGKLYHQSRDAAGKVGQALQAAVQATCDVADTFVRKPVAAGGRYVAGGLWRSTRRLFGWWR